MEKIEAISNKYIKNNDKVYYKDVSLTKAKEINGLRAVFGETYPDPVRVVSIGVLVDDLLADPTNTKWHEISIEFCGGTHVAKTGDIKDLVIIEESGIAKGIRKLLLLLDMMLIMFKKLLMNLNKKSTMLQVYHLVLLKNLNLKNWELP